MFAQLERGGLGEGADAKRAGGPQTAARHCAPGGAAGHLNDGRRAALLAQESRRGTEEGKRPPGRHRRPLLKPVRFSCCELATSEWSRTAAAIGGGGVDDQVHAAVALGHRAQRLQN